MHVLGALDHRPLGVGSLPFVEGQAAVLCKVGPDQCSTQAARRQGGSAAAAPPSACTDVLPLCRWLADRAAGVQRLSLRLDLPETAAAREVGWQLLLAALAAVGPTLQQLELSWPGQMEVGGWLVDLPRLTAASLDARELLVRLGWAAGRWGKRAGAVPAARVSFWQCKSGNALQGGCA